jgi:hypothetical protein
MMDNTILDGGQTRITRETMREIAYQHPAVYASLVMVEKGQMTYEEAMMTCVYYFAKENKSLTDRLVGFYQNSRQPSWF